MTDALVEQLTGDDPALAPPRRRGPRGPGGPTVPRPALLDVLATTDDAMLRNSVAIALSEDRLRSAYEAIDPPWASNDPERHEQVIARLLELFVTGPG
jgi:hypothetical protein